MTSWRGARPRKDEVAIAKNYLDEKELAALNNLVEQYLVFAEGQAMKRTPMNMKDWILKLNGFLTLNDRDILDNAGRISHEIVKTLAEQEYEKYLQKSLAQPSKSDIDFEQFFQKTKALPKSKKGKK